MKYVVSTMAAIGAAGTVVGVFVGATFIKALIDASDDLGSQSTQRQPQPPRLGQ